MKTGKNLRKHSSQDFENLQSNSENDQVTDSESEIIQSATDTSIAQTSTSKSIIKTKKKGPENKD